MPMILTKRNQRSKAIEKRLKMVNKKLIEIFGEDPIIETKILTVDVRNPRSIRDLISPIDYALSHCAYCGGNISVDGTAYTYRNPKIREVLFGPHNTRECAEKRLLLYLKKLVEEELEALKFN